MAFTGDHAVKNIKNEANSNVMLNDHKDGKKTMIENFANEGNVKVQGNHVIKNIENSGKDAKFIALERAFPEQK